jgi:uncharacterized membrane protein YjjB (DUF3815 family)
MSRYSKASYILFVLFSFVPTVALAVVFPVRGNTNLPAGGVGPSGGGYKPISGVSFAGSFESILEGLFKYGVIIAVILAIIMLVVGGIQYMGSESLFAKDEGRKRMTAALGGLLIALFSIFLLNLIVGSGGQGDFNAGSL